MTEGETSPPPPPAAPSEETPATAPPVPPPIPITIFISGSSGSKVISNNQNKIKMILTSLGILMELVDISAPGTEKKRDFMREKAEKKENQRNVLPPQVFNGDKYCGDYEAFDIANEDDGLEEFLGLPRKTTKKIPSGDTEPAEGALPEKVTEENTTTKKTTLSEKVEVEENCEEEEEEIEEFGGTENEDREEED